MRMASIASPKRRLCCSGRARSDWQSRTRPVRGRFLSATSSSRIGDFVKEVPYDPDLYFVGEEISLTVRRSRTATILLIRPRSSSGTSTRGSTDEALGRSREDARHRARSGTSVMRRARRGSAVPRRPPRRRVGCGTAGPSRSTRPTPGLSFPTPARAGVHPSRGAAEPGGASRLGPSGSARIACESISIRSHCRGGEDRSAFLVRRVHDASATRSIVEI